MPDMPKDLRPYLVAAIALGVWGATPAVTQLAVAGIDAVSVGMLRTIIAAAIVLPLAALLRLPRPADRGGWAALAVSSLAGFVGYTLLYTIGQKLTSTAHAALILASAPILTGFIGFAVRRAWPRWLWWAGALVALAGEAILIGFRAAGAAGAASLEGDGIIFLSAVFVSAGYIAGGRLASKIGTQAATAWGIGVAGVALTPALILRTSAVPLSITAANAPSWAAVVFLAVFTSIVGYAAWYWAIDRGGVARITPLQFIQPVLSVALGALVLGEAISAPTALALAAILAGMLLTRRAVARHG